MCKNKVSIWGERFQNEDETYTYKELEMTCGSLNCNGERVLCDDCLSAAEKNYPQGWRYTPGDVCKHGNFVGGSCGPDYLCGLCESEDPYCEGE